MTKASRYFTVVAIADFSEEIRLDPNLPQSYLGRAKAYRDWATKKRLPRTNARLKS